MLEVFIVSTLILVACMLLLCIKLLFRKDGKFSSQHVHDNPGLRKRGIHCVIDQDREMRTKSRYAVKEINNK
jgi:hypothetical protein